MAGYRVKHVLAARLAHTRAQQAAIPA
jgi:hypothetical protein